MKNKLFAIALFMAAFTSALFPQVSGDYRSNVAALSLWSAASSWETFDGTAWVAATTPPTVTSNVTIVKYDTLTFDVDATVASLTISDTSQLAMATSRVLNGNITIHGTLNVSGAMTLTTNGNVTVSGPSAQLKFASNGGNLTGVAGKTFTLSNGALLQTSTNVTVFPGALPATIVNLTWVVDNSLNCTTISFKNGGNSTFFSPLPNNQVFGNVKFTTASSTLTKTFNFGSDFAILGNMSFEPGTTAGAGNTITYNLGTFKVRTSGTEKTVFVSQVSNTALVITGTADTLFSGFARGNFVPATNTNCLVNYSSPNAQAVLGGTYAQLKGSGAATKELIGDVTVMDSLTLSGCNINTGAKALTIGDTATFVRTSEYIIGNLTKGISTGATSKIFEIGTAAGYSPVSVTFGNVTTAGKLTAGVTESTHPNATIPANTLKRFWTLTAAAPLAYDNYSSTFTYLPADFNTGVTEATDEATLMVGKYSSGWTFPAIGTRTPGAAADGGSIEVTGLTSFSDFAIGKPGSITSVETASSLVADFELFQNYPNPFNPATKIKFVIPVTAFVNVSIFNSLGEKIATLVNENLVQGVYEKRFEATDLTSGIYVYKLTAGTYSVSKKMILIK